MLMEWRIVGSLVKAVARLAETPFFTNAICESWKGVFWR